MKARGYLLAAILLTAGCLEYYPLETAKKWLKPIEEEPWREVLSDLPPNSLAVALPSETEMDGQIWITGEGRIVFGGPTVGMVVGDLYEGYRTGKAFRAISRGYLSFEITSIPADARVEKAVLYLFQHWVVHGNPLEIGNVYIKHHHYPENIFKAPMEREFTNADTEVWGNLPSSQQEMTEWKMVSNSTWEGWKAVDVTEWVREDLRTGENHSQFMLALYSCAIEGGEFVCRQTDRDSEGDAFLYSTGEGLSGGLRYIPHLIVIYKLPDGESEPDEGTAG